MKIKQKYPNYHSALLFLIEDKNPVLGSDDSILLSYYINHRNMKRTFDYYELVPIPSGGVYFRITTFRGLRKIMETNSQAFFNDLASNEWTDIILDISTTHFGKEQYLALKHGYVKKSQGGCMLVLSVLFTFSIILYSLI